MFLVDKFPHANFNRDNSREDQVLSERIERESLSSAESVKQRGDEYDKRMNTAQQIHYHHTNDAGTPGQVLISTRDIPNSSLIVEDRLIAYAVDDNLEPVQRRTELVSRSNNQRQTVQAGHGYKQNRGAEPVIINPVSQKTAQKQFVQPRVLRQSPSGAKFRQPVTSRLQNFRCSTPVLEKIRQFKQLHELHRLERLHQVRSSLLPSALIVAETTTGVADANPNARAAGYRLSGSDAARISSPTKSWCTWRDVNQSDVYDDVEKYISENDLLPIDKRDRIMTWLEHGRLAIKSMEDERCRICSLVPDVKITETSVEAASATFSAMSMENN